MGAHAGERGEDVRGVLADRRTAGLEDDAGEGNRTRASSRCVRRVRRGGCRRVGRGHGHDGARAGRDGHASGAGGVVGGGPMILGEINYSAADVAAAEAAQIATDVAAVEAKKDKILTGTTILTVGGTLADVVIAANGTVLGNETSRNSPPAQNKVANGTPYMALGVSYLGSAPTAGNTTNLVVSDLSLSFAFNP